MDNQDIAVIGIIAILLFGAVYFFYNELYAQNSAFEEFISNYTNGVPNYTSQFFPNMRFQSKTIPFTILDNCDSEKRKDIFTAMSILEDKTIISFEESKGNGITFDCSSEAISEFSNETSDNQHIVAGLAKPEDIVNASNFFIIKKGLVALPVSEKCKNPQVALHEILHALGFDHSSNEKSIMFPVSNCNQVIDQSIIDELNRLYSVPSNPDIIIEKVQVNKTGRYLSIVMDISNYGLSSAENSTLIISSNSGTLKEYNFNTLGIGKENQLSIENLLYSGNGELNFDIKTKENDMNPENNKAKIILN